MLTFLTFCLVYLTSLLRNQQNNPRKLKYQAIENNWNLKLLKAIFTQSNLKNNFDNPQMITNN